MTGLQNNRQAPHSIPRSSDGHPVHPGHSQFHLLRLLIGSLLGGFTIVLVFMVLGFLGSIEFTQSFKLAAKWILVAGTILGITLGLFFSIIAAILVNIIPPLRRSVHPLALVRAGFLIVTVWPLIALALWPATGLGFVIGPIVAAVIALLGITSNPHAELVPHSTLGRVIGTAIGPFLAVCLMLMVIVPISNRGFGNPHPPGLIVIAVDGVDGPFLQQILRTDDSDRFPNLKNLKEQGGYGSLGSTQPMIPDRMWADLMTGTDVENHGILDRHSTSDDLDSLTLWEILPLYNKKVGLFQMSPAHKKMMDAGFDIPPPGSGEARLDPLALVLGEVRRTGQNEISPSPFRIVYLACLLARHGVRLETIADLGKEYLIEITTDPSPRLIYLKRKLLEFRIERDCALALIRKNPVDAAFLRFTSLRSLFMTYWRYSKPNEFGPHPEDIDSALSTGLARAIPDAYLEIDALITDLEPYRDYRSTIVIVSNHGIRSASDRRQLQFQLSPERLIRICGMQNRIVGDSSGNGICIRAIENFDDHDPLDELEELMGGAAWSSTQDQSGYSRNLLTAGRESGCLEISIIPASDLLNESWVTIGDWSGPLSDILIPGEPFSGQIGGTGLLLVSGPRFKAGAMSNNPYLFDVTTTLLHALNIEVSEELLGRSMDELLNPDWLSEHPIKYIEGYNLAPPAPVENIQQSIAPGESIELSTIEPDIPAEFSIIEPKFIEI